jgi:ubiquitin-like protein Pup
MSERLQPHKNKRTEAEVKADSVADMEAIAARRVEAEKQMKDIDDLLDDIEEVLVENALSFVTDFVQKGGE